MKLVFFIGHAGSGKTTISEALAKKTKSVYLDKDVIGKHYMDKLSTVMGLDPKDRDSEHYETHFRDMEYLAMLDIAAHNLLLGNDVYLVAPFSRETRNADWIDLYVEKHGIAKEALEVYVVHVYVEDKTIQKERIIERRVARDEWKLANWESYQHTLEKSFRVAWDLPTGHVLHFHNHRPLSESVIQELHNALR